MTPATHSSRPEHLRRNNLSRILSLLHDVGPLSRSELSERTTLNRSTIALVVAELVELGLVAEQTPRSLAGRPGAVLGRPSPVVHLDPRALAVAVSLEVDATTVGLVDLGGHVVSSTRIETATVPSVEEFVSIAANAARSLIAAVGSPRIFGAAIAVPGQVRSSDGQVRDATHLGWIEEPIAAMFERNFGVRTFAGNAALLSMRAEAAFGVGRNVDDFVYIVGGSSGIGGGVVSGGRILVGADGSAGEVGHTFVRTNGAPCHCGSSGCLEAEISEAAVRAAAGLLVETGHELAIGLATSTDPIVQELLTDNRELLGIALRNVINLFNPRVVVVAGFLGVLLEAGGELATRELIAPAIRSARETVTIMPVLFGSDQLLVGAAELVFADLLRDPHSADGAQSEAARA